MKSKETQEKLVEASDNALKKAVEEVSKDMRFYFFIDRSGSMDNSIQKAKTHIARFLQAFPLDRVHVCAFNSIGKEIEIKHASAAGVENAFRGITATGGTTHASGVRCLSKYKPQANEDTVFFFVGDEEESGTFEAEVRASGLNPLAFAFVKIDAATGAAAWRQQQNFNRSCIRDTANRLGVPCFLVDENTFADPYAIPRTVRNLIASTPVTQQTTAIPRNARKTLAIVDFEQAARAALAITGAVYLDHRNSPRRNEKVVRFRFMNRRFECVCDQNMRIIDAGICLTSHDTGEKGDDRFSLESLPSVIREAIEDDVLVVFRHVN